jgi:putative restriction endonuclease
MAKILQSRELLAQILNAIDQSGWQALLIDSKKPYRLRLFREDGIGMVVRIYLWNCTHGGGSARASDEYRVQLTSVIPSIAPGESTLLLGWHSDYEVFVGFDINKHANQASQSPSIQVKEETLQNARSHAFSIYHRQNSEIAVAFRPEFLVEYILNINALHSSGKASKDLALLNKLDTLKQSIIDSVANTERRTILSQIARKFRATDFRRRVLSAYEHQCAFCGIQLKLLDAAHIIPVAATESTDETKNGIALCKLHHAAFDRNLLSFDEKYRIEISKSEISRLQDLNLVGGFDGFKKHLRDVLILPSDRRDYPPPSYIQTARKVRSWNP